MTNWKGDDPVSTEDFNDQVLFDRNQRNELRRRLIKVEQRLDALNIACGVSSRTGITDNTAFRRPDHEDYIPVDDDGVWQVSASTMNLLYAMYLWADKHGIDNEDDWADHLKLMRKHLNNIYGEN